MSERPGNVDSAPTSSSGALNVDIIYVVGVILLRIISADFQPSGKYVYKNSDLCLRIRSGLSTTRKKPPSFFPGVQGCMSHK